MAMLSKKPKKITKISKAYTKLDLLNALTARTELSKKLVSSVLEELEVIIAGHLKKGAAETFVLSGILRMSVKKVPAKKARIGINPLTREKIIFKAKPASRKVKVVPLKKLKDMVS
jgi:nucleoid DNA-binding protein